MSGRVRIAFMGIHGSAKTTQAQLIHAGKLAAVDGISLSPRAMSHAKHVLDKLGFDVSGEVELTPESLDGRRVQVQIVLEEREDPATGRRQVRNRVPYRGYESADSEAEPVPWDQRSA